MSLWVKICGITDRAAAEAAVAAGADAIGFVFSPSPRRISPEGAVSIADAVRSEIEVVAVFRRPAPSGVLRAVDAIAPDMIQADHDVLPEMSGVRALPVYREGAIDDAVPATRFLYEGAVSGAGTPVDLDRARLIAQRGEMILAGGLRPDMVAHAIDVVRPAGVDVSSGVEAAPGVKDPARINDFVAAARAAQPRKVGS